MFLLIYVTVNIKTHPVARMRVWRRLRHWSMSSSITLCYTPIHASNRCRLKSFTSSAFCGRLAEFVMKCTEARAVRWPEVWKFQGSLTLLHFRSNWRSKWCTECQCRHSSWKRQRPAEFIKKMIMWYCRVYNQIASYVWRYNNPIYKLMTNNEQTATDFN